MYPKVTYKVKSTNVTVDIHLPKVPRFRLKPYDLFPYSALPCNLMCDIYIKYMSSWARRQTPLVIQTRYSFEG